MTEHNKLKVGHPSLANSLHSPGCFGWLLAVGLGLNVTAHLEWPSLPGL
jgi:hypothetical protein